MYLLLAGLATPLVVSVHSVVSSDFAAALLPGWHSTIFPPYFVAGAIFSGMAMVLTLMLVVRKVLHLEDYLTPRHIDAMAKLVLATSCMVGLSYAIEFFTAFYEGNPYETFTFANRAFGPLGWAFAIMVACNVLIPQLFWFQAVRRRLLLVFAISILVNVGMWMERFVIIVSSLERDFLPSSWTGYAPTLIELATLLGSFGLFFSCFLAFCRLLPVIAMAEVKGVLAAKHDHGAGVRGQGSGVGQPRPCRGLTPCPLPLTPWVPWPQWSSWPVSRRRKTCWRRYEPCRSGPGTSSMSTPPIPYTAWSRRSAGGVPGCRRRVCWAARPGPGWPCGSSSGRRRRTGPSMWEAGRGIRFPRSSPWPSRAWSCSPASAWWRPGSFAAGCIRGRRPARR